MGKRKVAPLVPGEPTTRISVVVHQIIADRLHQIAAGNGTTLSDVARVALTEYVTQGFDWQTGEPRDIPPTAVEGEFRVAKDLAG